MKITQSKKKKTVRVKELKQKEEKIKAAPKKVDPKLNKDEFKLAKNLKHDGQAFKKGMKFTKEDKFFEILKQHAE